MKTAICAIMKNEEASVEEWIAHHLMLGVSTVVVFDNNSQDLTAELVRRAGRLFDVRLMPWPFVYDRSQVDCYFVACGVLKTDFDWVGFIDSDEFLLPDPGVDLGEFLAQHEAAGASAVALNWAMFGSSGHQDDPPGMLGHFTHRAPLAFGPNAHTKMWVRPRQVQACINPHYFQVEGPIVSATGTPMTWTPTKGLAAGIPILSPMRVNHYFTRSHAAWGRRMRRGQMNSSRSWAEFEAYDRNEVADTTALPYLERAQPIRDALHGLV